MSLYTEWRNLSDNHESQEAEVKFWEAYLQAEASIYNELLNNKTEYKVIDKSFKLNNPGIFTMNGKTYVFAGWKLADETKEIDGIDFNGQAVSQNVVIETGTTGHLTFIATWKILSNDKKPQIKDEPVLNKDPDSKQEHNKKNNVQTSDSYLFELWLALGVVSLMSLKVLMSKKNKYE